MKRFFLVEDEYIVREGIKKRIDWEANGLEFVGEAADGEVALTMIEKLRPDIIMTDIKMPFMDGLELSRRVKESWPETEIIILTGHADFEYAREGMKIGIAQYLTKPVKPDEIIEALSSVIKKLEEKENVENKQREKMMEREERLKEYYASMNMPAAEETLDMNEIDLKQIDRVRLMEYLKLGDKTEAEDFIEETFNGMAENVMQSLLFRQYIIMDTYFCVCDFVEGLGEERSRIEQPDASSRAMTDVDSARAYFTRIIKVALELRDNKSFNKYEDVVNKIRQFVTEHYNDPNMSLNMAAEAVGFSPNHLSSVFSQQTGQTFIKFLTDYRMDKAKELLRCTSLRAIDIAAQIGYEDSHYFSYLFKKHTGQTPSQFRGGKE